MPGRDRLPQRLYRTRPAGKTCRVPWPDGLWQISQAPGRIGSHLMPVLRNILVTGGAGFIGQNFVHHLAGRQETPRIVVLDALTYAANPSSLEPLIASGRIEFIKGDITDLASLEALFAAKSFDSVAHLAAESHVDRSIL